MQLPLAEIDGGVIAGITIVGTIMMVPIIGMLTRHQQKMAEIFHGKAHAQALKAELDAVKAEVSSLRSQIEVQSLAIKSLSDGKPANLSSETERLSQRLS